MNRLDKAKEAARREALGAAWKESAQKLRDDLDADARKDYRENGSGTTWTWKDFGRVTLPLSNEAPVIDDITALRKWVKERYPEHIETVEQVIASFQTWLMQNAVCEDGVVVHPETGEVIPGMSVREGGQPGPLTMTLEPGVKALFRNYARQRVAAELRDEYGEEAAQESSVSDPDGA